MKKPPKFEITHDAADLITLQSLRAHLGYLQEANKILKKAGIEGHREEDLKDNLLLEIHIKAVIKYFGG